MANDLANDSSDGGSYGSFVDGDHVISDLINHSGMNVHPRIIITQEKIDELKTHIGENSVTGSLLDKLRKEADRIIKDEEIPEYDAYGTKHLLETSKAIQRHVATLALAYNILGDEKYAERAYLFLKKACTYPDWSPKHFLDTAEMCTAFAYGYDWLYHWLTPAQRDTIRTNMIKKGLNQVMEDYTDTPANRTRTYKWYQDDDGDNWQLVCTGGTNLAALAICDESDAKDVASKVLTYGYERAYTFVRHAYSTIDGTYKESLGYWDYATYYLGLQSSALKSTTGTDYGLADYEGVYKSAFFVRYMSSNIPLSFSFGDDREDRNSAWAVFLWLGEQFDASELSSVRIRYLASTTTYSYFDILWMDESRYIAQEPYRDTDWAILGASNASFRTSWGPEAIVAALHTGVNDYFYHGHYDLGSFYIESNGKRFFTDLGNEDYELPNREYSYRLKAEGHNTLVINPTEDIDQRDGANCVITSSKSGNIAYATTDLTDAYGPSGAKSVVRGLKMIKDKECVIVQDEISLNAPGEIYWFAHTKGKIDVAADGRSAIVTVDSERLWVGLLSEGGQLTAMNAEPLPTSMYVPGAAKNDEYKKLAIHLTNTQNTTICVACIPLKDGETAPSWTPSVIPFSEWPSEGEPGPGTGTPAPGTGTPAPGTDTPVPGSGTPAPGTGTPEPQPGKDPSFEEFVERLYTVALGRASEPEGKAYWVEQVVKNGFTGADCARFFMLGAQEFLGRNLTDDEFVEVLYKTYFD
ncbi:MAG: heparinase II/III family protein, partial [Clostridiales bacterium]|nr:heparinase II/III family protein [Clostridiales bacterium]